MFFMIEVMMANVLFVRAAVSCELKVHVLLVFLKIFLNLIMKKCSKMKVKRAK